MISLRSPRIDSFFICNLTVRFNTLHMLCSLNLINGKQQKKKKLRREDVDCLSGTCRIKIQLKHFCQSHIAGVNSIIRRIELLIKFLQSLIRTCCCHVRFELIKRKAKTTPTPKPFFLLATIFPLDCIWSTTSFFSLCPYL